MTNPYAIYVNCDGAMDYDSKNTGGVGFAIKFPDNVPFDDITSSIGIYTGGNIEKLELEALIQAMKEVIYVFKVYCDKLRSVHQNIFITDRFGLCDSEKTSPYQIRDWRHNKWKSHEGKPIKNHELLDELDKTRKKLCEQSYSRVSIEYRPRKKNKVADKLAKAGKTEGLKTDKLAKKGEKIGRRKFNGPEVKYKLFSEKEELHIRIFRKDPVQDEWEVWGEICDGDKHGQKLKIYTDDKLAGKLKRMNEFVVKIKTVYSRHLRIYKILKKPKSK